MYRTIFSILGATAIAFTGCQQTTTTAPSTNPNKPDEKRELTITSPGSQNITRNGTDKFTVSISRKNFGGQVDITLKNLPEGVEVVNPPAEPYTIMNDKDSVEITLRAKADAKPVNDHKISIVAKAKDQKDMKEVTEMFEIDVKE